MNKEHKLNRRSLLRLGVASSPVIMSLASGPVAASGVTGCFVASSFVSAATFQSRNAGATVECATKNCEYWRVQSAETEPLPHLLLSVKEVLGGTSSFDNMLVKDVFLYGSEISRSGRIGVLQHCLAMVMNIIYNHLPNPGAINLLYMQEVWRSYATNSKYTSKDGITLSEEQLISWLRILMYPMPG